MPPHEKRGQKPLASVEETTSMGLNTFALRMAPGYTATKRFLVSEAPRRHDNSVGSTLPPYGSPTVGLNSLRMAVRRVELFTDGLP